MSPEAVTARMCASTGRRRSRADGCCVADHDVACAPIAITAGICTAAGCASRIGELLSANERASVSVATAVPPHSTRMGRMPAVAKAPDWPRERRRAWERSSQARSRSEEPASTTIEGLCQRQQRGCARVSTRTRNPVDAQMIFYGDIHPIGGHCRKASVVFL